jgi:hypothetical protein
MKQTAVEWLIIQMHTHWTNEDVTFQTLLEQAKAMEKEQIIDSFVECWKENMPEGYECKQSAEYYYNETYKKD